MPHPTLAELLGTPVVGSFEFDSELLRNLDLIALDERLPMADRAKAIRYKANVVMGLELEDNPSDAEEVRLYEEDLVSMLGYEGAESMKDEANERGEWGAQ